MLAVDEMIVRLIDDLRESGELDETYIVFTSDNGWSQGEHRRRSGKSAAYEENVRVPLIIRGPGVPEGETRRHMVINNDLAPTFADLANTETPDFVDGHTLTPLLKDNPPSLESWRRDFLVEGYDLNSEKSSRTPFKAVRTEDYLWVEYVTGERELYDLRRDPYQLESIHETADEETISTLQELLDALRDCAAEECRRAEGFD